MIIYKITVDWYVTLRSMFGECFEEERGMYLSLEKAKDGFNLVVENVEIELEQDDSLVRAAVNILACCPRSEAENFNGFSYDYDDDFYYKVITFKQLGYSEG